MRLALKQVDGPVTTTRSRRRMVWFRLPPQLWSYRSVQEKNRFIDAGAACYAGLVGRDFRIRVTSRPYPGDLWARRTHDEFPNRQPGWGENLQAAQRSILGLTFADREVYLGVQLHHTRQSAIADEVRELAGVLSGTGVQARLAEPGEMEWLMHRSVCLGSPAPFTLPPPLGHFDTDDLAAFTDRARWGTLPFGRSVRIVGDVNGAQHVRHVVALSMGPMGDLDIPGSIEPWLQRSDRLFPVEWSLHGRVQTASKARDFARQAIEKIDAQFAHWAAHGQQPPVQMQEQQTQALELERELAGGDPLATRVDVWVRAAVSGATEDEALTKAGQLVDLYQPQIRMERSSVDQYGQCREFIPGERRSTDAHRRKMDVRLLAAAGPAVAAVVGDKTGFHMGGTAGASKRVFCWHPWWAMERREKQGLTVIASAPGGGKSTLIGTVAWWTAHVGIREVILDPSGPLARLCQLPELRGISRHVDLMDAEPGSMNPFSDSVIATPRREQWLADRDEDVTDEQWEAASARKFARKLAVTEAAHRTLAVDVLRSLLPSALYEARETYMALAAAARTVPGVPTSSPWMIVDNLRAAKESFARDLAGIIEDLAQLPQVQLIFPPRGELVRPVLSEDVILQVLTMRGNVIADPDKPRKEWSVEETVGMPLLTLAAKTTQRHIYSGDMHERKLVGMDEIDQITRVPAGVALVRQSSRDSRKFNTRVIASGQNVTDTMMARVANLVDNTFIGWMKGDDEIGAGLRLLEIAEGSGFEQVLRGLSPRERQSEDHTDTREFLVNDGDGGIEKVFIVRPEALREVLNTTAAPTRGLVKS